MKKIIYTLAIGLSTYAGIAQTSEKRDLKDFTKIQAEGAANVILKQGEPTSVEIKSEDEKELKNLITDVNGSTLYIGTKGNINGEIKVYITLKDLKAITSSGAASVVADSTFNCDKLELSSSGASKIKMDMIAKELQTSLSGASSMVLSGAAETHSALTSGASSLKSYKLTTLSTSLTTSGASSAKINANQKLTVLASGASSVKYIGEPTDKTINASGTAEVKQVDANETNIKLNDIDTTKIKWGNKKYMIIDEDDDKWNVDWNTNFNHWGGIELNLNGLTGANGSTSLPASSEHMSINYGLKSLSWNLNLIEKDFHIYKDYINIVTGIGFGFNSYQFKNPIRLNPDSSYTNYFKDSTITFDKNKLKTSYVQIPLLLEFNTSSKASKSFHLAAGVIGGYKLNSKTYRTYEINGYKFEERRKDDYNINPFKLDATVRVGYGAFTMFGTYSLTPLFEKNKGPELNAFTVGVRIIPF